MNIHFFQNLNQASFIEVTKTLRIESSWKTLKIQKLELNVVTLNEQKCKRYIFVYALRI